MFEKPPLVTTKCESSSSVPAASKDICHTLGTTVTPYSTQTSAPSSMAISMSERETLQVPHSENGTRIPLGRDGTKLLFQELKLQYVFPL